jgi:hypothetical protein
MREGGRVSLSLIFFCARFSLGKHCNIIHVMPDEIDNLRPAATQTPTQTPTNGGEPTLADVLFG